jgi:hypothetical protein
MKNKLILNASNEMLLTLLNLTLLATRKWFYKKIAYSVSKISFEDTSSAGGEVDCSVTLQIQRSLASK